MRDGWGRDEEEEDEGGRREHKRDINGFVINEKSSHERGRERTSDQDR